MLHVTSLILICPYITSSFTPRLPLQCRILFRKHPHKVFRFMLFFFFDFKMTACCKNRKHAIKHEQENALAE